MSLFSTLEDFEAIMLSPPDPMREVVLADAWERFKLPKYNDTSARVFKTEMKTECAHYFAVPHVDTTEHAAFHSLSAQAAYCREHGEAATAELLKTEGLKLGQIKPPAKVDPAETFKGSTNPYSDAFKGTKEQREAAIARLINNRDGTALASQLARAANRSITGQKLQAVGAARARG